MKIFFLFASMLLSHCCLAAKSNNPHNFACSIKIPRENPIPIFAGLSDSAYYNIDGKRALNLQNLTPEQIAFIQVLNANQAKMIFGPGYEKGLLYVTTFRNKYSDLNADIQERINRLDPPARSYTSISSGRRQILTKAIEFAEKEKWLILINHEPSDLEHLRTISLKNIVNIGYKEGDQSKTYGDAAKRGVISVTTKL